MDEYTAMEITYMLSYSLLTIVCMILIHVYSKESTKSMELEIENVDLKFRLFLQSEIINLYIKDNSKDERSSISTTKKG